MPELSFYQWLHASPYAKIFCWLHNFRGFFFELQFAMKTRITFLILLAVAALLPAQSPKPAKKVALTLTDEKGLAIKGYDPVAYFTLNKATQGSESFTAQYQGATYRFLSAEHRDRFQKDPAKYVPQFGGYCAWAVGNNYTAPADPEAWKIVDGKLYLNYNSKVQQRWMADEANLIQKATKNWPDLHN